MGRTMIYSDEMVYSAIVKFVEENRYPPTVRELCKIVGASTATIHEKLKSLQAKGYIQTISGARRTIQINDTMDVVRVIRCKDCKYWERRLVNAKGFTICAASGMDITADDFCSYGERREGNG